ncbi:hypothetical protein Unana1_07593 [Umbelopsis nana]
MFKADNVRALHRKLLRAGSFATWPSSADKRVVWSKIRDGICEHRHETDPDKLKVLETTGMDTAGRYQGIEHQIVKNLILLHNFRSQYEERPPFYNKKLRPDVAELHKHAYDELDMTVAMLNQSLGLCLR